MQGSVEKVEEVTEEEPVADKADSDEGNVTEETITEGEEEPVAESDQEAEPESDEQDPQEQLAEILSKKAELEVVESKLRTQQEAAAQEESALRHKLASNLVDGLFDSLVQLASEFTEGVILERYERIQAHIEKIKTHDRSFPSSLSQSKYDVNAVKNLDFWLHHLSGISQGMPLDKFLGYVFKKPHGSPFSNE